MEDFRNLVRTIPRVTLGYLKICIFKPFDVLIIQCTQIEVQESHTVTEKERKKEGKNDIDGNRREQQNLLWGLAPTRGFVDRCHGTRTMEQYGEERVGEDEMIVRSAPAINASAYGTHGIR